MRFLKPCIYYELQEIGHLIPRKIRTHTALLLSAAAIVLPLGLCAQNTALGIAWRVIGPWQVEGRPGLLSNGVAIEPESLLEPEEGAQAHSITILLPDGQRILYECFAPQDCARGFRVPSLYRKPQPIAIDLLERVNAVSLQRNKDPRLTGSSGDEVRVPRDEAVAELGPGDQVEIAGLAAALSNGSYSYEVRPLSRDSKAQPRRPFAKSARSITLALPSAGLFDILIRDTSKTPRIDFLVAALRAPRAAAVIKSFQDVKALMRDWNEDYQGWPIHEFQQDYLRSILLDIQPTPNRAYAQAVASPETHTADTTAEPAFSPKPGVFRGDTEVTLHCGTPGATVHYTVDGSQPINGSTVYHAPIMVKGTALTIKAFASATGKKDSPVVTGIFRLGD